MNWQYLRSRWERFRWGFSLADLQACADAIDHQWGAQIDTLECSYLNRRRYLRLCDTHRCWPSHSCLSFASDGDVKLVASRDVGDVVWFAYSKTKGTFYMLPYSREVGKPSPPLGLLPRGLRAGSRWHKACIGT